ncbi:MAG: glycosyltransferase family 4 protein [Candidatus Binataceae bacterium]
MTRAIDSRWHIVTGEYPPQRGGVSDYSRLVARELIKAGLEVHVWAPACGVAGDSDPGVSVHRLPGHFGPRALRALDRGVSSGGHLLVQYVPHAFGWKAMNLPFCLWLLSRRRNGVTVMFHETAFPLSRRQSIRHNTLGAVTRVMAMLVARAAERIIVSTPGWERLLRPIIPRTRRIEWSPVPSNVPVVDDPGGVAETRARYQAPGGLILGHFGAYQRLIVDPLAELLSAILDGRGPSRSAPVCALLMGENSEVFRTRLLRANPHLADRIHATGMLAAPQLSLHLAVCDVMVQPYPDGATTRRGSLMAALAHGIPVVTTAGFLTEPLWQNSDAILMAPVGDTAALRRLTERLLADERERIRQGRAAKELYARRFDVSHTIELLLGTISTRQRHQLAIGAA